MICLMSRKGNGWDNAPTEGFFNRLKKERVQASVMARRPRHRPTSSATSRRSTTSAGAFHARPRLAHEIPGNWISAQRERKSAA